MRTLLIRAAVGAAAVATSAGFLIGTAAPAAAAGCSTSYHSYSLVHVGKTGSKAGAVECLLHRAGYATSQNRSFSSADAERLEAFQRKHGLSATGKADHATWAALIAQGSTPSLRSGSDGASVRRLQLALRALGHDELPGTTHYGSLTTAAVKQLQRSVGMKATGTTTSAVWAVLQAGGHQVAAAPAPTSGATSSNSGSKGATALAFAKAQLGEKYKYGAAGPSSWDCSGLTMKAWAAAGVKLPHSSQSQYKIGKKVAKADLQPGDLVFFYSGPSHVAIYAGDGLVVHAPHAGAKVSYIKMAYMPFKGARRPG